MEENTPLFLSTRQLVNFSEETLAAFPKRLEHVMLLITIIAATLLGFAIYYSDSFIYQFLNMGMGLTFTLGCYLAGSQLSAAQYELTRHIKNPKIRCWGITDEMVENLEDYETAQERQLVKWSGGIVVGGVILFIFIMPYIEMILGLNLSLLFFAWFNIILVKMIYMQYQMIKDIPEIVSNNYVHATDENNLDELSEIEVTLAPEMLSEQEGEEEEKEKISPWHLF